MTKGKSFSEKELTTLHATLPGISGNQEDRFIQACIQYYRDWLKQRLATDSFNGIQQSKAFTFVYSKSPRVELENLAADEFENKRVFDFSFAIEDGLMLANENLKVCYQLIQEFSDVNENIRFLEESEFSARCFVIILPAQKRVLIHRENEAFDEWLDEPHAEQIDTAVTEIGPDLIYSQVNNFHEKCTKTARGTISRLMWDTKNMKFRHMPELHVQSGLMIHFRALLPEASVIVDEEVPNPGGRLDIRITRYDKSLQKLITSILELKVLCPKKSQNENSEWAVSGVQQANSYRDSNTDTCFACIFDGRKDKQQVLSGLQKASEELNVKLSMNEMELPKPRSKAATKAKNQAKSTG